MTIKEILNQGIIMLKNEGIESPKNKARIILEYTLKKTREYIIIYDNKMITPKQRDEYIKNIKKVIRGVPIQYITGIQEFMKLKFFVTKDVLIPQPDTEILVEEVIKIAKNMKKPAILDLCTGSGAIAISIAKYIPNLNIIATDISSKALEIAKQNAKFNGVKQNIEFIESDLFAKLKDKKFDIIVSNPPYIPTNDIKTLPKDVQFEPIIALDGGLDGLNFYNKIINASDDFLRKNGYLCLEIGYNQKESIRKIISNDKKIKDAYFKKDLCKNDRVVIAQYV